MLTYHSTDIFSIMSERNLNMTILECFENVMCLQGYLQALLKMKNLGTLVIHSRLTPLF